MYGAYITRPPWARVLQRALYIFRYILLVCSGIIALNLGSSARLNLVGIGLCLFGTVALLGVLTRRFQFELTSLWFIIASLMGAVLILVSNQSYTTSLLVAALIPGLSARLLYLSLLARRARDVP